MTKKKIDLAIIGAGPAGISAAIYARMDAINFVLIEKKQPCCFMKESINSHYYVDGFTGSKRNTTGTALKNSFINHYKRLGGKILDDEVITLTKNKNLFDLETKKDKFSAKTVIIASGTIPKKLEVEGADKLENRNIHYFCTINGRRYIGKNALVVGGRNSGATAACYLKNLGCKVSLIEIRDKIQAKEKYQRLLSQKKVKIYTSTEIIKIVSSHGRLENILAEIKGQIKKIQADGIFVYIGLKPNINFCHFNLKADNDGYLLVDHYNQTSQKGIYAAGDVTPRLKQAITACGDGANAYYFAKKYLDGVEY